MPSESRTSNMIDPSARDLLHPVVEALNAWSSPITISDADQPDTPVVYANPAFLTFAGRSFGEIKGRNLRFLQGVETDIVAANSIDIAIHEGKDAEQCLLVYRKDGEAVHCFVASSNLILRGGRRLVLEVRIDFDALVMTRLNSDEAVKGTTLPGSVARNAIDAARLRFETVKMRATATTMMARSHFRRSRLLGDVMLGRNRQTPKWLLFADAL